MSAFQKRLQAFGVQKRECVELHNRQKFESRVLRYTDLIGRVGEAKPVVDCVVENQNRPLLYVVGHKRLKGGNKDDRHDAIMELQKKLAMRGEQAWLGVLHPGELEIYATDLKPDQAKPIHNISPDFGLATLSKLALGMDESSPKQHHLRKVLFDLMKHAVKDLRRFDLLPEDAVAISGRALFLRYLLDRKIISQEFLSNIANDHEGERYLDSALNDAQGLAQVCEWLDKTFNGDLLPLWQGQGSYRLHFPMLVDEFGDEFTRPFRAILGLDSAYGPAQYQKSFSIYWNDLKFDHVPIGLLSETYEELMSDIDAEGQKKSSAFYTPHRIANYMVNEVLDDTLPRGSETRLFDPSCGAGVFLVAGFKRLVELKFRKKGQWPTRNEVRNILHKRLVGRDINPHAINLAALSLYLTALELDPDPYSQPLDALKFKDLKQGSLPPLQSLEQYKDVGGTLSDAEFDKYKNRFDVVIGNPPWTSLSGKNANVIDKIYTQRCIDVAKEKGLHDDSAKIHYSPDKSTDLPFAWAAMHWTRPGGRIAIVMAARLLFKQSPQGIKSREALFKALKISHIVNCTSLRTHKVWPNIRFPFCLLFAENERPSEQHEFFYINPYYEPALNDDGGLIRVDANDAKPIPLDLALSNPSALITLYVGTPLDLQLLSKIHGIPDGSITTIGEYWNEKNLNKGQGITRGSASASKKADDAIHGHYLLEAGYDAHPFVVLKEALEKYELNTKNLERTRDPDIFRKPLLVVPARLNQDRTKGRALICDLDLVYSVSYRGYSAHGHGHWQELLDYMLVILNSKLFEYHIILTSGRYTSHNSATVLGMDIDNFPIRRLECVSSDHYELIRKVASSLKADSLDQEELDSLVRRIYDLSDDDQSRIDDVLEIHNHNALFNRGPGLDETERAQAKKFVSCLEKELDSVFSAGSYRVNVKLIDDDNDTPWRFFSVTLNGAASPQRLSGKLLKDIHDRLDSTQITIIDESYPGLIIGLLNRRRHWMPSESRLLASRILWRYGADLEESVSNGDHDADLEATVYDGD